MQNGQQSSFSNVKRRKKIFIIAMLALPILNWLVFWLYVNIQSIALAFIDPLTRKLTFANFIEVWDSVTTPYGNTLGLSLINTLKYFGVQMFITVPLCLIVAFFFYKKIAGYKAYRIVFYLPAIVPSIAYVTAFSEFIANNGPLGVILQKLGANLDPQGFLGSPKTATTTILVYCVYAGMTTNVLLFTSGMTRIPLEVLEAAKLDGVGPARELVQIIFPLIWPTFSTQLIFMMTGVFNSSGPILLFTNGQMDTTTLSYWIFAALYRSGAGATPTSYAIVSCTGLCASLIAVPLILLSRRLVEKVEVVEY